MHIKEKRKERGGSFNPKFYKMLINRVKPTKKHQMHVQK